MLRACIAALSLLIVAGCGFQPLYQQGGPQDPGVDAQLAAIAIAPIRDREGQQLHNILLDRLQPHGQSGDRYRLVTELDISRVELGLALDATTRRARIVVTARFRLIEDRQQIYSFSSRSASSFSTVEADYASVVAQQHAIERSLTEIGDDVRLRLAAFLRSRGAG